MSDYAFRLVLDSAFVELRFRGALPRLRGRLSAGRDLNHRLLRTDRLCGVVERCAMKIATKWHNRTAQGFSPG
jgi:hypothetical protein